jgi:phosphoribosylformimino-5-aminoimidazole carboxamide ribotide isomerase
MIVIPAIDIRGGRCVRLYQGREDRERVYSTDPAAMAQRWQQEGAEYLHVVDLDGAFKGAPQNLIVLKEILERVAIPLEFGGGLREIGIIRRVFAMGADRVVLGTAAIRDRDFLRSVVKEFGRQVFVGIDVRKGRMAIKGWTESVKDTPEEMLAELQEIGVGGVIYTDVLTDGTLSGPNISALDELLGITGMKIIASGGVASIEHIEQLKKLHEGRLYGVIIGQALYSGALRLREVLEEASGGEEKGGPGR